VAEEIRGAREIHSQTLQRLRSSDLRAPDIEEPDVEDDYNYIWPMRIEQVSGISAENYLEKAEGESRNSTIHARVCWPKAARQISGLEGS